MKTIILGDNIIKKNMGNKIIKNIIMGNKILGAK